jgi:hypothetical protein
MIRIRTLWPVALALAAPALIAAAAPAASPAASQTAITLAQARDSLVGRWEGKLEYRDYQANEWFGLPVTVSIRDGGDGVTQLRVADFDDGPQIGIVRITSVSMLGKDGVTEYTATFRKGRAAELDSAQLALTAGSDATHWTLVSTETASDDDRPAQIRATTTRNGDLLVALKEVDFTDDAGEAWLVRNRETLKRVGD